MRAVEDAAVKLTRTARRDRTRRQGKQVMVGQRAAPLDLVPIVDNDAAEIVPFDVIESW